MVPTVIRTRDSDFELPEYCVELVLPPSPYPMLPTPRLFCLAYMRSLLMKPRRQLISRYLGSFRVS